MGEGMPWNIILIFFFLGIFVGINRGKKDKKENENLNRL
jgi:hypothetical protein